MALSLFKLHFSKAKANEISYRNFSDIKEDNFNWDLQNRLSAEFVQKYAPFENVFLDVFNKHAPLKKKIVRAYHAPYISKTLKNVIMKRSYLENVCFKKKTPDLLTKCKKQKNYCSKFYQKGWEKKLESLNSRKISDNKSFW